jgi:uncharacterized membrane protein YkvA (DUF1232 family)
MGEMLNKEKVNQILNERSEEAKLVMKNKEALVNMLVEAEEKVRANQPLASIQDLPVMMHIVRNYAYGSASGISEDAIAVMTGALLYLTDSNDYFDDSTPVIGLFDDMAVIWAAIDRVQKEIRAFGK